MMQPLTCYPLKKKSILGCMISVSNSNMSHYAVRLRCPGLVPILKVEWLYPSL